MRLHRTFSFSKSSVDITVPQHTQCLLRWTQLHGIMTTSIKPLLQHIPSSSPLLSSLHITSPSGSCLKLKPWQSRFQTFHPSWNLLMPSPRNPLASIWPLFCSHLLGAWYLWERGVLLLGGRQLLFGCKLARASLRIGLLLVSEKFWFIRVLGYIWILSFLWPQPRTA